MRLTPLETLYHVHVVKVVGSIFSLTREAKKSPPLHLDKRKVQ